MVIIIPITNQSSCYLLQKFDNMRPTNPPTIICDNHMGKASVVKPSGGIVKKGKGKASVVKPKATKREEQGKGKCFHYQS